MPGTFIAWPDVLHEGPTPLASGDEWIQVRARYLASAGYGEPGGSLDDVHREYRQTQRRPRVVRRARRSRVLVRARSLRPVAAHPAPVVAARQDRLHAFSLVCGDEYLGLAEAGGVPAVVRGAGSRSPRSRFASGRARGRPSAARTRRACCRSRPRTRDQSSRLPYLRSGDPAASRGVSVDDERAGAQRAADPSGALGGAAHARGGVRRGGTPRGFHLHGGFELLDHRPAPGRSARGRWSRPRCSRAPGVCHPARWR